jgi:hypothetical protein
MNQPGTDSFSLQQEQEQEHGSAVDLWLGADAAQRQALAAWLLWSRWYRLLLASFRNAIQFGLWDIFGVPGSTQSPHGLITRRELHGFHFRTHHGEWKRV